jgi:Sec-independent protein translocase protein TatA
MKIFNIGALEGVFIVLIAFIVLGPKKAVKLASDLGRWLRNLKNSQFWRDLKGISEDINNFPQELMRDADIQQEFNNLNRSDNTENPPVNDIPEDRDMKKK